MSNISRRQFLKSAGVAALAVAALTGCKKIPGTDVPDVPEVTSVDLRVIFVDVAGDPIGNSVDGVYDTKVLKGEKKYDPKLIPTEKLPKGYELYSTDKVDIIAESTPMLAKVMLKQHVEYKDSFYAKINIRFPLTGAEERSFVMEISDRSRKELKFADVEAKIRENFKDIEIIDTEWEGWLTEDTGKGYRDTFPAIAARLKG